MSFDERKVIKVFETNAEKMAFLSGILCMGVHLENRVGPLGFLVKAVGVPFLTHYVKRQGVNMDDFELAFICNSEPFTGDADDEC